MGYRAPYALPSATRIDYAQLVKDIEEDEPRGILKVRKIERPDPDRISTSMVERANLAMRTRMRRFPRQTMGFSRKAINHAHAVDLNFMVSNFVLLTCPQLRYHFLC